jgi:hypothetical protein
MEKGQADSGQPLGRTRQVTIDALCEHFANDAIPVEEFERRVDAAHKASSVEGLKELLRDLPGGNLPVPASGSPAPAPRPRPGVAASVHQKENGFVVAVLGGAVRKGRWTPARRNFAMAVMGGAELDFREATLPPGVTEVQVFTVMGGVEIIVPPGVNVESHGIGIMGGFEHKAEDGAYDMNAPVLRIAGLAVMGGVDISVRHPGESARDARRRRKLEVKERKRLKNSWE